MKSRRFSSIAASGLLALFGAGLAIAWGSPAPKEGTWQVATGDSTWRDEGDRQRLEARIALGRAIFFDPILSRNRTVSCASCHVPELSFGGDTSHSIGIDNMVHRRHAPVLINRAMGTSQFWDGRVATLEEQALLPIENEIEFDSTIEEILLRLNTSRRYSRAFAAAYVDGVTADNLANALAEFQRTIVAGDSPADRFMEGDFSALSDAQRRGKWIFESKAQCWRCHSGPNFSDESFHNTGVSWDRRPIDLGRFEVTGDDDDRGAFKTPTLRNIAFSPPYMHDGSMRTLREVVDHYVQGGGDNPWLSPHIRPLNLSEQEIDALIAFLESLTSSSILDAIEFDGE